MAMRITGRRFYFKLPLSEGLTGIVYHFESPDKALNTLKNDRFYLNSNLGGGMDKGSMDSKFYYLCTTRLKGNNEGFPGFSDSIRYGTNLVRFTLDGQALGSRYKAHPYDMFTGAGHAVRIPGGSYDDSMNSKMHVRDETEDRVLSAQPTIQNASRYITAIDVLVPMERGQYSSYLKALVQWLSTSTLAGKAHFYSDQNSFNAQRNPITPQQAMDILGGVEGKEKNQGGGTMMDFPIALSLGIMGMAGKLDVDNAQVVYNNAKHLYRQYGLFQYGKMDLDQMSMQGMVKSYAYNPDELKKSITALFSGTNGDSNIQAAGKAMVTGTMKKCGINTVSQFDRAVEGSISARLNSFFYKLLSDFKDPRRFPKGEAMSISVMPVRALTQNDGKFVGVKGENGYSNIYDSENGKLVFNSWLKLSRNRSTIYNGFMVYGAGDDPSTRTCYLCNLNEDGKVVIKAPIIRIDDSGVATIDESGETAKPIRFFDLNSGKMMFGGNGGTFLDGRTVLLGINGGYWLYDMRRRAYLNNEPFKVCKEVDGAIDWNGGGTYLETDKGYFKLADGKLSPVDKAKERARGVMWR